MTTTYTKLRGGDWGIRTDEDVSDGARVTVSKKGGGTKTETIARVLWRGNGVALCSIARQAASDRPDSFQKRRKRFKQRHGWDGVEGSPSYYTSGLYDEES